MVAAALGIEFAGDDGLVLVADKNWRRGSELNRRIEVLQTSALPLGYRALTWERSTLQEKNHRASAEITASPSIFPVSRPTLGVWS